MERMLPLKTLSVLVTLAAVLYTLPSPLDPYLWRRPFALPTWNEEWTLNDHLLGSERLAHGLLHGPESIALHPDPFVNEVFASVAGGLVVQVAANGSYVHDIFFVGGSILNI